MFPSHFFFVQFLFVVFMSMACDADAVYASCVRLARALDSSEASVVLIRHGESLANVSNVVCSLMHNGIKPEYSLSPKGKQQAHESGAVFAKTLPAAHHVLIYTSPFSRATATAEIFGHACAKSASASGAVEQPHVVEWLRERCFGEDAELKPSNEPYERYWRTSTYAQPCCIHNRILPSLTQLEKNIRSRRRGSFHTTSGRRCRSRICWRGRASHGVRFY